jgi:L-methionine (R)-S-oxide reductase
MDARETISRIHEVLADRNAARADKAKRIADLIRFAGSYRWVGLYDVDEAEIAAIGWTGRNAPAHPRFPVSQGLSGAAVRSGSPVVVGDVSKDPRYLTALGSTRSEAIIPVRKGSNVVGTIDVENERLNAFSEGDVAFLEKCAGAALGLWP